MKHPPGPSEEGLSHSTDQRILLNSPGATADAGTAGAPRPEAVLLPDSLSDQGDARMFVSLYGRAFRYVPGLGWYRWSGCRWQPDEDDTVRDSARTMADALARTDPRGRLSDAALREHRERILSAPGTNALLRHVASTPGMIINPSLLDADPYALCTPEGVISLHTGRLHPPDPDRHRHSHATSVAPRIMETPRWTRFLTDTFGDGVDGRRMIRFVQELLGHSLTGEAGPRITPFLYGRGKNGKSVLLDVTVRLLGDYADEAPPGFLTAPAETRPTDLTELRGRRLVACPGTRPGERFDEARMRLLTSGERLTAHPAHHGAFGFSPTHTLWLSGNHRPTGADVHPFRGRLTLVPFERTVADGRRIDNLPDLLVKEEGPGILHWLIMGARRYLSGGRRITSPRHASVGPPVGSQDHPTRHGAPPDTAPGHPPCRPHPPIH